MKTHRFKISCLLVLLLMVLGSCSNGLDEELFGSLSPENYYQNEDEALSSVVGVYERMSDVVNYGDAWRLSVLGTDEFIIAARTNGGWYDGGIYHQFTTHQITPTNDVISDAWGQVFGIIGAANAVMESIQSSPKADQLTSVIAEVRALRAYAYFYAMDYWGNVPLVTTARIDPSNLPTNTPRAEVFDFIEQEMLTAVQNLPSVNDVNRTDYYPRFTKEAIQSALAMLYLNAEVYTGEARYSDAITMCQNVIDSGGYILEPDFITSFTGSNNESQELISSFSIEPAQNAGGNTYLRGALHPLHQKKYDLPFVPANGFNTFEEAFNRYEDNDVRRNYIVWGPQTYLNGDPLLDDEGNQLELIPFVDYTNAEANEGYRVLKYIPDGNWVGRNADNDVVLMRYSDILLTQAEAMLRAGQASNADGDTPLDLVNMVRERSNASTLNSVTLDDLEMERAREFIWEGHRRRDMIRFGSYFNETWKFKTSQTPEWRGIYPIPESEITANPNLEQNPNY